MSTSAVAQVEIVGYVKSSITGLAPISEVYVEITNIDRPVFDRMALADSTGRFLLKRLEKNTTYTLKAYASGYGNQVFEIKTDSLIDTVTLVLNESCEYSKEQAEIDWNNGKAKLLLIGSIAPAANTKWDKKFERAYGVRYFDFGDTPPIYECVKIYNTRIFELMDQKFGKDWRNQVRRDVEYLTD